MLPKLADRSFQRIAQAAGYGSPLPSSFEEYMQDTEQATSFPSEAELAEFSKALHEEGAYSDEDITELIRRFEELQSQVEEISSRVDTMEGGPLYSHSTRPYVDEGSDWWDNYLAENPYPYPTSEYSY